MLWTLLCYSGWSVIPVVGDDVIFGVVGWREGSQVNAIAIKCISY
jgi:hypothetical protein